MLRRSRSTVRLHSPEPTNPIPARNQPRAGPSGEGNPVGLKIVIDGSGLDTNVVIKSSLRSPPPKPAGDEGYFLPSSLPELSFLKACFLCKKQLSPEKDVYIYRGDRGFCSMECRCRQIFLDERRERCASVLDRAAPPCGGGRKKSRTSGRGGIPAAA